MAVGADRAAVLRMIVLDGGRLVAAGLALGLLGSFALGRTIASFLFATKPTDPLVLLGVVTLLGMAGVLASYVPARRAARVDPAIVLRGE